MVFLLYRDGCLLEQFLIEIALVSMKQTRATKA